MPDKETLYELRKQVSALELDPGQLSERALALAMDCYEKGIALASAPGSDATRIPAEALAEAREAGYQAGRQESADAARESGIEQGRAEMKAQLVEEFETLEKQDIETGATEPKNFAEAVKAVGYQEARRRFPTLFDISERRRRKQRRPPVVYPAT